MYLRVQALARDCGSNLIYACESAAPTTLAIRGERGRTCWPSPISHAPRFLHHRKPSHTPTARPSPARGLAYGHPTRPILSPLCVSLSVPHSSATSAFGLFGQESPPPAAYNNKPTLVTVSEWVCVCVCVCVCESDRERWSIRGGEEELGVKSNTLRT